MSNILFKTNAVHRVVGGRENNTSLHIALNSADFNTLEELKAKLMDEIRASGVHARINSIEMNNKPIVSIHEIKEAPKGVDFVISVTQLTAKEVNGLKSIKIKRDQLNQQKELISKRETVREALQKKLSLLDKEISELKDTSQQLLNDLLLEAKQLPRLIPQSGLTSVHMAQKNTLFSSSASMSVKASLHQEKVVSQQAFSEPAPAA